MLGLSCFVYTNSDILARTKLILGTETQVGTQTRNWCVRSLRSLGITSDHLHSVLVDLLLFRAHSTGTRSPTFEAAS